MEATPSGKHLSTCFWWQKLCFLSRPNDNEIEESFFQISLESIIEKMEGKWLIFKDTELVLLVEIRV